MATHTKTGKRTRIYRRYARIRTFLLHLIEKYEVKCFFCGKQLTEADIPLRKVDRITEHHIDGNHDNNDILNKAFAHRSCHKRHHMEKLHEEEKI